MVPRLAKKAADTGPETSQVNAPPDDAGRQADWMAAGHTSAEDAASRPQDESAKPKSDGNPVEPAALRAN
jgi:hypothetical protein